MKLLLMRRKKLQEPVTAQEWQMAVDGAEFVLLLDSAQQYGLIEWGGKVNAQRCVDILTRGEALGYVPAPVDDLVKRFIR